MKIVVLTTRIPYPLMDGGSIATMQMLQSLINCGYVVKLLSLNTNKHFVEKGSLPPIFNTLAIESTDIDTNVNFKDAFKNLFSDKSYNANRFYSDDFRQLIVQTLLRSDYDVVLFDGIYSAVYLNTVKQFSKAKRILRPHNIEHDIWIKAALDESFPKNWYISLLAKKLKKFEYLSWPLFDAIIPISIIDEFTIRKAANTTQKIRTLPTAIDVKKIIANNALADCKKIFHLGSMDWAPNQQAMEWFLSMVWNKVESACKGQFFMAGRNMPEDFFKYANDRIKVEGDIENVYEFMNDKQIMVVPLFAGSGIRIKILEGMAAAKTIITTSLGVQGIDAYDKEHVMIANNPLAFADAIIWCVKNETKCKEIGNNARKLIEEKYSIENFEEELSKFIAEVTS